MNLTKHELQDILNKIPDKNDHGVPMEIEFEMVSKEEREKYPSGFKHRHYIGCGCVASCIILLDQQIW